MKDIKTILRKKFPKQKYISIMYNSFHNNLYKYREIIRNTLIESVTITSKDVLFSIKDLINQKNLSQEKPIIIKGIEDDYRIAPIEILNFRTYEDKEIYITSEIIKKRGNNANPSHWHRNDDFFWLCTISSVGRH